MAVCLLCSYWIERSTLSGVPVQPGRPSFAWEQLPYENGLATVRINWLPSLQNNSGSDFYVKYRLQGDSDWKETGTIDKDDHIVIHELRPDENYEFAVVSVDGPLSAESETKEISTSAIGMCWPQKNGRTFW